MRTMKTSMRRSPPSVICQLSVFVGLSALVGGVGHHAMAQTGRQNLPCLYESGGALFFLVPASLGEFRLIGRRRADGSMPFPADFRVRIGPGN